ncbi:unnamed protein product [Pleuronectes platessa]|uniref:Uncharacterized protein n=1 Tax=Pleuronectes platessa TaxID=8262 RepID=A0A9N7UJ78_PLEPL|nr:unnamed protein product [Pleuronectes platessa]
MSANVFLFHILVKTEALAGRRRGRSVKRAASLHRPVSSSRLIVVWRGPSSAVGHRSGVVSALASPSPIPPTHQLRHTSRTFTCQLSLTLWSTCLGDADTASHLQALKLINQLITADSPRATKTSVESSGSLGKAGCL